MISELDLTFILGMQPRAVGRGLRDRQKPRGKQGSMVRQREPGD